MKKASLLILTTLFLGGNIQNGVQSVKINEEMHSVSMLHLDSQEKGKCPGGGDG